MKNKIIYTIVVLMAVIACTKDFAEIVTDTFSFEIKTEEKHLGMVGEKIATSVEIKPERVVLDEKYYFQYQIIEGEGTLYQEDYPIKPQSVIEMKELNKQFSFVTPKEGISKMKLIVYSSSERVRREKIITYEAKTTPFIFTVAAKPTVNTNEENDIHLKITTRYQDNFWIRYILKNSTETEIYEKGNPNNKLGTSFQPYDQDKKYVFVGKDTGEETFYFEVKNKLDIIKKDSIKVKFENKAFSLFANLDKAEVEVGEKGEIIFFLADKEKSNYKAFFYKKSGEGTLYNSAWEVKKVNTPFEVPVGNFSLFYVPAKEGTHELTFKIVDENGNEQIVELTLQATGSFDGFEVFADKVNYEYEDRAILHLNYNGQVGSKIRFTSNRNGRLIYGNNIYTAGELITLQQQNQRIYFIPEEVGEYELQFTLLHGRNEKNAKCKFFVHKKFVGSGEDSALEISADVEKNTTTIYEENPIYILINGLKAGEQAQAKFSFSGVNGTMYDASGTKINVNSYVPLTKGSTQWKFVSQSVGDATVLISAKNESGLEKTAQVKFKVQNSVLNFKAIKTQNEALLNEAVKINISLDAPPTAGTSYKLYYESGKGSLVKFRGFQYSPGQAILIQPGGMQLEYVGKEVGLHNISFKVRSNFGIEQTSDISLNFNSVNFDFNAVRESSTVKVGESVYVDLNVKEYIGSSTYQMQYLPSGVGMSLYDESNQKITAGKLYDIRTGNTRWRVVPNEAGDVIMDFTVQNATGVKRTAKVTLKATGSNSKTYAFTATPQKKIIGKEELVDVHFAITEMQGNGTYRMKYALDGEVNASLLKDGTTINAGTYQNLTDKQFSWQLKGTQVGKVGVIFTIINDLGEEKSQALQLTVSEKDEISQGFVLTAEPGKSLVTVNEEQDLHLLLESQQAGNNYKAKFSFSGVNGTMYDASGTKINVNSYVPLTKGSTQWKFVSQSVGDATVLISAKNESGLEKTAQVKFKVQNSALNFKAIKTQNEALLNEAVKINISLDAPPTAGTSYKLYYESGKGSLVKFRGFQYSPGQAILIQPGGMQLEYVGKEVGLHNISFKVRSNFGIEQTSDISLNFNNVNFDFNAVRESSTVKVGESVYVDLNVKEYIGSSTYQMQYLPSGVGMSLYDESNQKITAGKLYDIRTGNTRWRVVPNEAGDVIMDFTVQNATGVKRTAKVTLKALAKEYNFTAHTVEKEATVDKPLDINVSIQEIGAGGDSYKMYFTSENQGYITYQGTKYRSGEVFNVNKGNSTLVYVGEKAGNHNISLFATSSSQVVKQANVSLIYTTKSFSFSATAQKNVIYKGESIPINFEIHKTGDNTGKYRLKYTVESDTHAEINNGLKDVPSGTYLAMPGDTFTWLLKGTQVGKVSIVFTIINEAGEEKSQTVLVTVSEKDFIFEASAGGAAFVNNFVDVNLNLQEFVSGGNYRLYFSTDGAGELYDGGTKYQSGQNFPIAVGAKQLKYKGLSAGNHQITLTVRSQDGIQKAQNVTIKYNQMDYNFSATAEKLNIIKGEQVPINFEINETGGTSTYQMKFEYSGSSVEGVVTDAAGDEVIPGVFKTITGNNFKWKFQSVDNGTALIKFVVRNASGNEKNQQVRVNIRQKDFNFEAIPGNGDFVNNYVTVNAKITEVIGNANSYQMFFVSNREGEIKYNGNTYQANQPFTVPKGNFMLQFKGKEAGLSNITLYVRSSDGTEKDKRISINFKQKSFEFTAVAQQSAIIVGNQTSINFSIQEEGGNSNYQAKYQVTGGVVGEEITYNEQVLVPGVYQNVYGANFIWNFKANEPGIYNVKITLKNSDNVEKTQNVSIKAQDRNFSFDIVADNTETSVGNSIDVKGTIKEIGDPGHSYEMRFEDGGNGGKILYKGGQYTQGAYFEVPVGAFNFKYKSENEGSKNVTFYVKSDYNREKEQSRTFSFKKGKFEVTTQTSTPLPTDRITKGEEMPIYINITDENDLGNTQYFVTIKELSGANFKYGVAGQGSYFNAGQKIPVKKGKNTIHCKLLTDQNKQFYTFDVKAESSTQQVVPYEQIDDVRVNVEKYIELNFNEKNLWYGILIRHVLFGITYRDKVITYIKPNAFTYVKDETKSEKLYTLKIELLLEGEEAEIVLEKRFDEALDLIRGKQYINDNFSNVNKDGIVNNTSRRVLDESIFFTPKGNDNWSFIETKYKKGVETPYARYRIQVIHSQTNKIEYEKTIFPRAFTYSFFLETLYEHN